MARQLLVEIIGNAKEFTKATGEAATSAEGMGTKLGGVAAAGVAAFAAVGVAAVAFGVESVKSTIDAGQAAFELSEKFGLLPGQASEWLVVGKQLGISGEQIGKGFQFLSKNATGMQLTLDSGGKIAGVTGEAYKEMGINVLDAGGHVKGAQQLMFESADAFKKMEDGPEKAALAMKLFGKSGTDLIPVLNQGSAGLRQMMNDGKAMGAVMSDEQVEAAHKLALQQEKLNTAFQGVQIQIGEFLMPIMTKLMDFVVGTGIPAIHRLGTYFMEHLWPAIQQVWAAAVQLATAFGQLLAPMIQYIRDHAEQLKPVLVAVGIVFAVVLGAVILVVAAVIAIVVALALIITWLAGVVADRVKAIKQSWDTVVSFVSQLPSRISNAASGMWNGITNAFRTMLNGIIGMWNRLHFDVPSILGSPAQHISLPQLPYFHSGGLVPGSGDMLAVLQGGERVIPKGQAYNGAINVHLHDSFIMEGPFIDILVNKIVARINSAPGT